MGKTSIEWATDTWSPITGCTPVSAGCKNCYAKRMAKRLAGRCGYPEAPHEFRVTVHDDKMDEPLRWRKPRRVFVCSMGDLFHENVNGTTIRRAWATMALCPQHRFLVLTKRPRSMCYEMNALRGLADSENWTLSQLCRPLPNVWLGVTAENQEMADERIPVLLSIPAAGHFVSYEPALGPVDFGPWLQPYWNAQELSRRNGRWGTCGDCPRDGEGNVYPERCKYTSRYDHQLPTGVWLDWTIAGAETGPGARPSHPDWFRQVRDDCREAGVPFLFKSWGGPQREGWVIGGQLYAGRLLDGVLHDEYPEMLKGADNG
jgi:protein gp37